MCTASRPAPTPDPRASTPLPLKAREQGFTQILSPGRGDVQPTRCGHGGVGAAAGDPGAEPARGRGRAVIALGLTNDQTRLEQGHDGVLTGRRTLGPSERRRSRADCPKADGNGRQVQAASATTMIAARASGAPCRRQPPPSSRPGRGGAAAAGGRTACVDEFLMLRRVSRSGCSAADRERSTSSPIPR